MLLHKSTVKAMLHYHLCRNLSRNFVATQAASEAARCNMPRNHKIRRHFLLQEALHEVEYGSTFRNDGHNAAVYFLVIAQCNTPLNATCLPIFLLSIL